MSATEREPDHEGPRRASSWQPPANMVILLVAAALVVAAVGLNLVESIFAPAFFALTLVLAGRPLQRWLQRLGLPRPVSAIVVLLGLYALLIMLVVAIGLSIMALTEIMPQYSARFTALYVDTLAWLESMNVDTAEVQARIGSSFSVSSVMSLLSSVWATMSSASAQLVTILLAMFFLSFDVPAVSEQMVRLERHKPDLVAALHSFSFRVRRYWIVSTVFGLIVAVLDVIALQALGVPLAITWGLFSFVTNYIPNVGFVLGLIPPAFVALLDQGPNTMIWVIVLYSVINFVLQSLVQPKFTGDAVGLSPTVTFLSLIFWTIVVGPLGAILAVPLTLFFQSVLIDSVPQARWINSFLGPERTDLPGGDDETDLSARVVRRVRDLAGRKPLRVPGASRISRRAVRGEWTSARAGSGDAGGAGGVGGADGVGGAGGASGAEAAASGGGTAAGAGAARRSRLPRMGLLRRRSRPRRAGGGAGASGASGTTGAAGKTGTAGTTGATGAARPETPRPTIPAPEPPQAS